MVKKTIELVLIRHGKTQGNLEKRYIGRTDESLCIQGIAELKEADINGVYPSRTQVSQYIYVSPMKRCRETAEILYPEKEQIVIPNLREMDFGVFEGKNYLDLEGNKSYQDWIDGGGIGAFPQGENRDAFENRCVKALKNWADEQQSEILKSRMQGKKMVFIVHGGTIMAWMHSLGIPRQDYYTYQCKNAGDIVCKMSLNEEKEGYIELNWSRTL